MLQKSFEELNDDGDVESQTRPEEADELASVMGHRTKCGDLRRLRSLGADQHIA